MKKTRLVLLICLVGSIAACSTTRNSAPVSERTVTTKPVEISRAAANGKTPAKPNADRGHYTVKKGDTLYRIALDFGQSYRDIVAWNNLANPNDIKVDQVLRVAPPESGSAPAGTQTGSVAASSGVEVRPLNSPAGPTNKTGPRGDKRPYSESNLAEMQKSDANSASASNAAEAKPAESPGAVVDEDAVSWMWPAEGKVVATFDEGRKGIDIAGKLGQQILAAGSGKVMYAGSGIRGYGNLVIVKHTNNLLSAYAHNKTILVKEGQTVNKGQKIAEMGNSDTDTVKLHFEIRQQGKPVDPSKFLPNVK
jgi:lipoprotein NlpD